MHKKFSIIILSIFFTLFLSACMSDGNSRYQNTADLERPPEVPGAGKAEEAEATDAVIEPKPRRHGIGLKSDIYQHEDNRGFNIKHSYDEAWLLIHQAIQHNDLKIADQDRSKGTYYVNYDGHSLLNLTGSFFGDHENQPTYLIKVEGQGTETSVTISLAKKEEQTVSGQHEDSNEKDKSDDLLELLFDTLHDHIKAD